MREQLKSEGVCLFCKKTYKKAGINRHLHKHLESEVIQGKPGQSYLLKVEPDTSWGRTPYFLSLWMDGNTAMQDLDDFLRAIWLECCGHMSAFRNPKLQARRSMFDFFEAEDLLEKGKTKEYEALMEASSGEIPMRRKAKKVFQKGLKLIYDYDFGSTTRLEIVVVAEYNTKAASDIVLLSRNEPIITPCSVCNKSAATQMCMQCIHHEDALFCEACAKDHAEDCEDFYPDPIVNSPRSGVCGYDGGTIDTQRDTLVL